MTARKQGGHDTEEEPGYQREGEREQHDGHIERHLIETGDRNAIGHEREQAAVERKGQYQADQAADECEEHAFGQHLAQQPAPSGAKRGAQPQLALSNGAAREQQVRNIDARDQQHQQHRRGEHVERRANLIDGLLVNRHQRNRPPGVARWRLFLEL